MTTARLHDGAPLEVSVFGTGPVVLVPLDTALVEGESPPSRAEVDALLAIDGTLYRGLPSAEARVADVAKRSGLSIREIRRLASVEAIEIETRQGADWLRGDSIRFVERWAALRRSGYAERLGFRPENLRVYVEFVRWLAREELRMFARGVTGKIDAPTASAMAEQGIEIVNDLIALLRRGTLLRYIAEGNLPAPASPAPVVWSSQNRR